MDFSACAPDAGLGASVARVVWAAGKEESGESVDIVGVVMAHAVMNSVAITTPAHHVSEKRPITFGKISE